MINLLCVLGGLFLGVVLTALVAAGRYDEVYLDGIERGRELEQNKNREFKFQCG